MTNIKNKKLLAAYAAIGFAHKGYSLAANVQAMPTTAAAKMLHGSCSLSCSFSTKPVPIFKNPQQDSSGSLAANAKATDYFVVGKGSQLILAAAAKPNLVFLQKKGSQIPNPKIISYNFPGSKPQNNTVAAQAATAVVGVGSAYYANKVKAAATNKLVAAATNNVYKLLFNFFKSMYCLISKPVFITTPDKIKIQLFYFLCIPTEGCSSLTAANKVKAAAIANASQGLALASLQRLHLGLNLTKVYPYKFKLICTVLSKFFNKNVELELIRLHQPYYDSNILVNFLALIINKKNIGACIQRLYNNNIIKANKATNQRLFLMHPQQHTSSSSNSSLWLYQHKAAAYLSGLNIKISGRLMREPIIPRITTKKFEKGFTAKGKINYFDLARFTHKNRKGAFTITVKSGQNF